MGPQTTATTVGLFPLAAIPPQTSRDLLMHLFCCPRRWGYTRFLPFAFTRSKNVESQGKPAHGTSSTWPTHSAVSLLLYFSLYSNNLSIITPHSLNHLPIF